MLFMKSEAFLLLPALLLVFSVISLSSLAHGASQYHQPPTTPVQDMRDGDEYSTVSWGMRRYLVEGTNAEAVQNSSLILAAERTHRRDLLDNFRYYKGGWNIREKHYLSSAGITGAPLFLIAAIWFLGFGLCLILIGLIYCCCSPRHRGDSPTVYAFSLIFLTLFTVAAITGCIVLYIGQGKFHHQTTTTLEHVLKKADTVVENLKNVSNSLAAAKQVGVDQIFLPADVQNNIDKVQKMINNSSITLENETKKNSKSIQHVLDSVRLALIIIAAVMLLLALLGFLFSVFSLKFLVYTSVIIGWILVTVTFILCGIFLIFHNMMADTCVAMDQWLQNPTAHTALGEILPCLDNATAEETLYESKDVTFQLVANVNQFITNVPNSPINELNYNQSGPMVPIVCNPFHSDRTDRKSCADGEVGLNNAAQEWKKYVCQVSKTDNCTSLGRLTPSFYNQMVAIVDVSSAVHNYRPFLVDIQDCTFVRKTFSDISDDHCPGLRHYSKFIYVELAMVSAAIMLSLILWVFNARERQHRVYKQFIASPPMSL